MILKLEANKKSLLIRRSTFLPSTWFQISCNRQINTDKTPNAFQKQTSLRSLIHRAAYFKTLPKLQYCQKRDELRFSALSNRIHPFIIMAPQPHPWRCWSYSFVSALSEEDCTCSNMACVLDWAVGVIDYDIEWPRASYDIRRRGNSCGSIALWPVHPPAKPLRLLYLGLIVANSFHLTLRVCWRKYENSSNINA